MKPSIIFFDELDGLIPVRSSRNDQIHASIVSTLLALMDGLDDRGEIIIIGATNRVDAIDPAFRRPGRFDRELYFPLPARRVCLAFQFLFSTIKYVCVQQKCNTFLKIVLKYDYVAQYQRARFVNEHEYYSWPRKLLNKNSIFFRNEKKSLKSMFLSG